MKLLVLGGTIFVGRHIVEAGRAAGHEVTLFHRGRSGPGLFPDATTVIGDRRRDLTKLRGGRWDAVVDTCGYHPAVVGRSAEFLRERASLYAFVSTVSVYRDWGEANREDSGCLVEASEEARPEEESAPEAYGPLKLACERAVERRFPGRALIVRPGLIAGPFDPTDRFTYWPLRAAQGGDALAPGEPDRLVQTVDARDLAEWIVDMADRGRAGTFNVCGPGIPMREVLEICRSAAGGDARFTWVGDEFLIARRVAPYTEMPLWVPGLHDRVDAGRALACGFSPRRLSDTTRDVLAWARARRKAHLCRNGMSPARESDLLEAWRAQTRYNTDQARGR